jgi:hypothetical protein
MFGTPLLGGNFLFYGGTARKEELLASSAAAESQAVLSCEIQSSPHLDGQIPAAERLVELSLIQGTSTPRLALVQYLLLHSSR